TKTVAVVGVVAAIVVPIAIALIPSAIWPWSADEPPGPPPSVVDWTDGHLGDRGVADVKVERGIRAGTVKPASSPWRRLKPHYVPLVYKAPGLGPVLIKRPKIKIPRRPVQPDKPPSWPNEAMPGRDPTVPSDGA
ncbi:MAG: hypothetical protein AAFR04_13510, partial [Pseudomonadota bacterium]